MRYWLPVSPGRITIIYQLAQRRCLARIDCKHCEHSVLVSAAIMERLFGPTESEQRREAGALHSVHVQGCPRVRDPAAEPVTAIA
jgi:hypothetical protein